MPTMLSGIGFYFILSPELLHSFLHLDMALELPQTSLLLDKHKKLSILFDWSHIQTELSFCFPSLCPPPQHSLDSDEPKSQKENEHWSCPSYHLNSNHSRSVCGFFLTLPLEDRWTLKDFTPHSIRGCSFALGEVPCMLPQASKLFVWDLNCSNQLMCHLPLNQLNNKL